MRTIIGILQALALFLVWGGISNVVWWGLLAVFVLLYLLSITNRNVSREDGEKVERFWHITSGFAFIVNVLAVVALYIYIFLF